MSISRIIPIICSRQVWQNELGQKVRVVALTTGGRCPHRGQPTSSPRVYGTEREYRVCLHVPSDPRKIWLLDERGDPVLLRNVILEGRRPPQNKPLIQNKPPSHWILATAELTPEPPIPFTPYLCIRMGQYRDPITGEPKPERRLPAIDSWSLSAQNWGRIGSGGYLCFLPIPTDSWQSPRRYPNAGNYVILDVGKRIMGMTATLEHGLYLGKCEEYDGGTRQWKAMPSGPGGHGSYPVDPWINLSEVHDTFTWLPLILEDDCSI